jgi:hypothetical protein
MDVPEIHTPQGELIIGDIVHGQAINCTVLPYADPADWFMVQFVTQAQLESYALENQLVMKRKEEDERD